MYYTNLQLKEIERLNHYLHCFRQLKEERKDKIKEWNYDNKKYDVTSDKGLKKLFKAHVKKHLNWVYYKEKSKPEEFINHFRQCKDDGEIYIDVYIFQNKEGVMKTIKANMDWKATPNHYDYSPTGLWFKDEAKFYTYKDRIIVTQVSRLDC